MDFSSEPGGQEQQNLSQEERLLRELILETTSSTSATTVDDPVEQRVSPDGDSYQREEIPEAISQNVIAVSSVANLHSELAEATREDERRHSTPDLSFVALARQVSVESLMELARPFFNSQQQAGLSETSHLPE